MSRIRKDAREPGEDFTNFSYIYSVYILLLLTAGVFVRYTAFGSIYIAVIRSACFDGTFIAILAAITVVFKPANTRFSAFSTLICALISAVLGIFYGAYVVPRVLFPFIHTFEPSTFTINYVGSAWLYYTMTATIWSLTILWTISIRAAIDNKIAAINARNEFEQRAMLSELRRLRQQLDPHFIFNSLSAIITEVYDNPRQAAASLRELSAYLRYTLAIGDQEFAPVASEIGALRSFLRVQDIRFGEKLVSSVDVEADACNRCIPTLLLQPLIENALKFGVADALGVLRIAVTVTTRDDAMTIAVRNSGFLRRAPQGRAGTGVGLQNLRARLAMHYGTRATFELRQVDETVVAVVVLEGQPE